MKIDKTIYVSVRSRAGLVFAGEVISISSKNAVGVFDVLPLHSNFISIIRGLLTLQIQETVGKEIPVDVGVIRVKENKVDIYVGALHYK